MDALNNIIGGLLDASPPFLLGFCLWVLGVFMRKVPFIQNWSIPFVLAGVGGLVYPFVAEVGKVSYNVRSPWMLNALIGFGIGGGAVMADQMKKQWQNFRGAKAVDEETKFFKRPADVPKTTEVTPPAPVDTSKDP